MPTDKYRVHRFDIRMTADQSKLEQFLNSLEGEIIAIVPNVTWFPRLHTWTFCSSWRRSRDKQIISYLHEVF